MSAEATAILQKLWEKLHFSTVKRVIVREPEDVQSIYLGVPLGEYPDGSPMFSNRVFTQYKRRADVPEAERWRMQVTWRHYFGFTEDDVFFRQPDFKLMDFDVDHTCTWGKYGNHDFGKYDLPEDGQLVCGEVVKTSKGERFVRWFPCDEAFRTLVLAVRGDISLTEAELGRRLVTDRHPDMYWAVARLALFDNVQAFVDLQELAKIRPHFSVDPDWTAPEKFRHPAAGQRHGKHAHKVMDDGMFLPSGTAQYLHTIAYQLDQPQWWQEYLRLTEEQGLAHFHPAFGGVCKGCLAEFRTDSRWSEDEFGWGHDEFPYTEHGDYWQQRNAQL